MVVCSAVLKAANWADVTAVLWVVRRAVTMERRRAEHLAVHSAALMAMT